VPSSLDTDPVAGIKMCQSTYARFMARVEMLDDEQLRRASRLPGWTVAHVLTHIARNADGHIHRLEGALAGTDRPRYPGGPAQRNADIERGAGRGSAEIQTDLIATQVALEQTWQRSVDAGWPHADFLGDDIWPTTASPIRRVREVEMHHVDLGLGYEPSEWPEDYVAWELPMLLETVPGRVPGLEDRRALLAWLAGRSSLPMEIELSSW
jgi:maleylpyruvate isomerase